MAGVTRRAHALVTSFVINTGTTIETQHIHMTFIDVIFTINTSISGVTVTLVAKVGFVISACSTIKTRVDVTRVLHRFTMITKEIVRAPTEVIVD
jgi:hypothetical protein